MDFGNYPPEVNSARIYAGAGPGPMLVAAEAWDALAAELLSAAASYQSVTTGLTAGPWRGPASEAMSAAAASYAGWLRATAALAEDTGVRARAAAAAYQTAYLATVPPPVVAANRSQLMSLVATNVFGRNAQAIAANEAQYGEMWAQDATAMYGYAVASAAATRLSPFPPPRQTTDPTGEAGQSNAVGQATGTAAGNAQNIIQHALSAVPSALQGAATATPAATSSSALDTISNLISIFVDLPANIAEFTADLPLGSLGLVSLPFDVVGAQTGIHTDKIVSGWNGEETWPGEGPAPVEPFPAPLLNLQSGALPQPRLSAGLAEANRVGGLSVPPTWTVNTPAVKPMAMALPALPASEVVAGQSPTGSALGEMGLAGMAGQAMGGAAGRVRGAVNRTTAASKAFGDSVIDDGNDSSKAEPRGVVTGIAAELREFSKLRDEGVLTEDEYAEQRNRLLGR